MSAVADIDEMGRRLSAAVRAMGISIRQMDAEYRVAHGLPDPNPMPRFHLFRRGPTPQ